MRRARWSSDEFGDLSVELDTRIKSSVASFCGKESYEFGDLSKEIGARVSTRVQEFTGKDYEFGDVSKEIEKRRVEWVNDFIGKSDYEFGERPHTRSPARRPGPASLAPHEVDTGAPVAALAR